MDWCSKGVFVYNYVRMVVIDWVVDYCIDVNCCFKGWENLIGVLLGWVMNVELIVFMYDI